MFKFRKCGRQRALPVAKATGKKAKTLKRLRSFLDAEEPQAVRWLLSVWDKQQAAVTYKELREAVLSGGMSEKQLQKWQKDYAKLVNTKLTPQWEQAMKAAAEARKAEYPYFLYNPSAEAMQAYIKQQGAQLITNLATEQRDAIQAIVAQAAHYDTITADSLSHMIRPVIGLTKPQSIANLNYYNAVKTELLKAHPRMTQESAEKKAREAAAKYAARQHRYRAMNIARTELATAYNQGGYGATKDAQERGYIGDCKKIWLTADDERVCAVCGGMDGESVNIDALFSIGKLLPPAHPSCRCAVAYEEISEPLTPNAENGTIKPEEPKTKPAKPKPAQTVEPLPLTGENIPPEQKPKKPVQYERYSDRSDVPNEYDEKLHSLTGKQKDALTLYTGSSYREINQHLRRGKATTFDIKRAIQEIDNAFATQAAEIPRNATLFRGCHPSTLEGWDALLKVPVSSWQGRTLSDKAFISTSIVEGSNFSGSVIFTIKAPEGTKGIFVSPISRYKSENEVLLNRGTVFKIDNATHDTSGNYYLDVTIVESNTNKPEQKPRTKIR